MERQVSVIIPIYNEEKNINIFYQELTDVITHLNENYEIIFVNDGSTDATSKILEELYENKNNATLKIITLSKRFGQTQAFQAGIDKSEGEIIVFIDGDLQNDPKDIPILLNVLKGDWDMVNGWRKHRKDPFFSKKLPSFIANMLIRKFSKVNLHDFGCGLKVFRKESLKNYSLLGSMHRLLPLHMVLKGHRVTEVVVTHRERAYGKSKYGFLRTYELMLELLRINFFEKHFSFPLYYFGISAFISSVTGIFLGGFVIIRKIVLKGPWISPLFFISIILFFLGIQSLLMGIVAEILVRISLQNNKERLYIIKEIKL